MVAKAAKANKILARIYLNFSDLKKDVFVFDVFFAIKIFYKFNKILRNYGRKVGKEFKTKN
jgi:hypothetical protein